MYTYVYTYTYLTQALKTERITKQYQVLFTENKQIITENEDLYSKHLIYEEKMIELAIMRASVETMDERVEHLTKMLVKRQKEYSKKIELMNQNVKSNFNNHQYHVNSHHNSSSSSSSSNKKNTNVKQKPSSPSSQRTFLKFLSHKIRTTKKSSSTSASANLKKTTDLKNLDRDLKLDPGQSQGRGRERAGGTGPTSTRYKPKPAVAATVSNDPLFVLTTAEKAVREQQEREEEAMTRAIEREVKEGARFTGSELEDFDPNQGLES